MSAGFVPIIAPVAVRPGSESMLNVNADTVAGEIAAAIGAERLVMLTDVEGVLDSSRRLIPTLTRRQAEGPMHSKVVDGGTVPQIRPCLKALEAANATHIGSDELRLGNGSRSRYSPCHRQTIHLSLHPPPL